MLWVWLRKDFHNCRDSLMYKRKLYELNFSKNLVITPIFKSKSKLISKSSSHDLFEWLRYLILGPIFNYFISVSRPSLKIHFHCLTQLVKILKLEVCNAETCIFLHCPQWPSTDHDAPRIKTIFLRCSAKTDASCTETSGKDYMDSALNKFRRKGSISDWYQNC